VPGDPKLKWSPNHPVDGESCLSASYAVKFSKDSVAPGSPPVITSLNTGGYDSNNIYTLDNWVATTKFSTYGSAIGTPTGTDAVYDTVLISYK
jgi:hypothetical protein